MPYRFSSINCIISFTMASVERSFQDEGKAVLWQRTTILTKQQQHCFKKTFLLLIQSKCGYTGKQPIAQVKVYIAKTSFYFGNSLLPRELIYCGFTLTCTPEIKTLTYSVGNDLNIWLQPGARWYHPNQRVVSLM